MAKLYFRYGTMNCGKSTVLMQVAHNYNENDNNCIKPHNKKNCYFYHISHINNNGFEKKIAEDRRREPISFSKFFNSQYEKSKKEIKKIGGLFHAIRIL